MMIIMVHMKDHLKEKMYELYVPYLFCIFLRFIPESFEVNFIELWSGR